MILLAIKHKGIKIQNPNRPYNAYGAIIHPKYIIQTIISIGILNIKNNYLKDV